LDGDVIISTEFCGSDVVIDVGIDGGGRGGCCWSADQRG